MGLLHNFRPLDGVIMAAGGLTHTCGLADGLAASRIPRCTTSSRLQIASRCFSSIAASGLPFAPPARGASLQLR